MRRRAWGMMLLITILICGGAQVSGMIKVEQQEEGHAAHFEDYPDIASSAVHWTYDRGVVPSEEQMTEEPPAEEPPAEENTEIWADYAEPEEWILTRETIIETAYELYGVSEEWTKWMIGTTWNEGYQSDRYLEYAWACEILNCYRSWSVWDLDGIWGDYYTIDRAFSGYYAADDTTLEMVWEALTDRDTRIVEVDGLIRWDVPGYYLIYNSDIYNCQVWGR